MYNRIYIFDFKKQQTEKKNKNQKKQKKLKKEREYLVKIILKKIAATRVKIFLVTCVSERRVFFFLGPQVVGSFKIEVISIAT